MITNKSDHDHKKIWSRSQIYLITITNKSDHDHKYIWSRSQIYLITMTNKVQNFNFSERRVRLHPHGGSLWGHCSKIWRTGDTVFLGREGGIFNLPNNSFYIPWESYSGLLGGREGTFFTLNTHFTDWLTHLLTCHLAIFTNKIFAECHHSRLFQNWGCHFCRLHKVTQVYIVKTIMSSLLLLFSQSKWWILQWYRIVNIYFISLCYILYFSPVETMNKIRVTFCRYILYYF